MERQSGREFTFLTVTNRGAQALNLARLRAEFPAAADSIDQQDWRVCVPGDPQSEGGIMVLQVGMRVRLTRNLDKDRGFVNGNTGTIDKVLRKDVFIMQSAQGTRILVHPIVDKGEAFASWIFQPPLHPMKPFIDP